MKMANKATEKTILNNLENLKMFRIRRGKSYAPGYGHIDVVGSYFDTSNIGIEIWYRQYYKWGMGYETYFSESIENPDRNMVIVTASDMGERRNYRELIERFYKGINQPSPHSYRFHTPSWHPTKNGPIGIVIPASNGRHRLIGFNSIETCNGTRWKDDTLGLIGKLRDLYFYPRRRHK